MQAVHRTSRPLPSPGHTVNIPDVLRTELSHKRKTGAAMLSSVCDPYQPVERRYRLTRQCIEALREHGWRIDILTRSPLVTRDTDLLATCMEASVGFPVPTDDEDVRRILEPAAPPIAARLQALRQMHEAGIRTWVFIAPVLPMNPERLAAQILPHTDHASVDSLNYQGQVAFLFRRHGWDDALTDDYAQNTGARLVRFLGEKSRQA